MKQSDANKAHMKRMRERGFIYLSNVAIPEDKRLEHRRIIREWRKEQLVKISLNSD